MRLRLSVCLLALGVVIAFEAAAADSPASPPPGDKQVGGMSILGDDEAPKSLVIVPWKSSDLGNTLAVSKGLDAGRDPVDRKSFGRAVDYYEIRAGRSR